MTTQNTTNSKDSEAERFTLDKENKSSSTNREQEENPSFLRKEAKKSQENSIFIGGKPFMNYVTGVIMQFNNGADEVKVKARGKFISKGVDVAEVARRKFLVEQNVSVKNVAIGSEEFENKEGKLVNVSVLEITLKK